LSINLIVCHDRAGAIGFQNNLLAHQSEDLKRFKRLTLNNYVLMGSRTYESIGRLLPKRHNIILSRNKKYKVAPGGFVRHSLEDVIKEYKLNNNEQELFICGGSDVYKQAIPYVDKMYITVIDHKFDKVDSIFPEFDMDEWESVGYEKHPADENNEFDYWFITYKRK